MTKTWKRIDEFSEHRSSVDMRKGILSPGEQPVTIAVLDTGILSSHTAFMSADDGPKGYGRTIKVKNFVPSSYGSYENDEWLDRNGHGTHCASIAAGGTFRAWIPENKQEGALPSRECGDIECGVAPFATLVVGKIATTKGFSKPEWMAEALDWIVNLEREDNIKVDIISLSVGYAKFSKRLFDSVCRTLLAGKVIVCASSNDGRRQQTNISFPARFGNVLCVGSHSKKGQPSEFSPNGREIDVLGPGEDVWAALSANEHGAVFPFSGTSAATPFVAGVCALILVAAQRIGGETLRSRVSNTSMMREILRKMATKPGHHDESMGYGNVDPWNVFNYGNAYFKRIIDDVLELDDNSAPTRVKQLPE
ncbi:uncharacterized protein LOC106156231 [Lingula anatina]|uniref:Uncharacterized protein LOC106156231 n=1 Tax=Lingula anatina TaxID=7574 RepID=A0A1S3HMU8_LINAN|nr:uncharacterized protein LOC106156231 [Lingula anatina]|eukprot:XP_013386831.1 uncharacterized protein LOC106156231 [Lingula anatina]